MTNFTPEFFIQNEIDYIQFQFTTLLGDLKAVEIPAKNWEDMREGTGVDGSSLGFLATEQSDMRAIPDYSTYSILPWDDGLARFICDMYGNDGTPHPLDPRSIFKRVLNQAQEMGFTYLTRPELEWYFVTDNMVPADEAKYMATVPMDIFHFLRRQITDYMILTFPKGAPHTIHHECGPGQHEIELMKCEALSQSDNVQTSKIIIKTVALEEEIIGTFMPKPFPDQAGNGLHIHQYLENEKGENVFSEESGVSDILRHFIGGTIKHIDALCAILNPSTNSYKRLVPDHEAPVYTAWGIANRTALMRVPGYENKAHVEYRAGDASMNIYLGNAVLLAAGLDGIKKKIEPPAPTSKNVDNMTDKERKELGITQLPKSLEEAVDAFEQSSFMKGVLGKPFMDIYIATKHEEIREHKEAVEHGKETEWERKKYLFC
ncbi:MAG: glutamine synthetase [Candidatus Lokiarchaeota archaeon]|nr:glutamine synthetase [Candidatus Lokiarchaeota archaeon]